MWYRCLSCAPDWGICQWQAVAALELELRTSQAPRPTLNRNCHHCTGRCSAQWAVAVKKALTTYYVIPARNLVTAGYGERYLKIPTADAEEENRRVSLQRVTPLVGEAEET